MLYNLAIYLYTLGIRLAALFSPKARLWVDGRKDIFHSIEVELADKPKGKQLLWIHCASLGEFEQGRSIIELIQSNSDQFLVFLTFFSPSGYEIRKDYALADYVFYLPADSPRNAKKFMAIVQPDLAIFVKYEFWFNYLHTLFKSETPTLLISALFRKEQLFFQWYGGLFKNLLPKFQQLFVQNEASATLLKELGLDNFQIAGDTRVDRVLQIAKEAKHFPLIEAFAKDHKIFIVGSNWPEDDAILCPFINTYQSQDWKYIFAPHKLSNSLLEQLEQELSPKSLRYSKAKPADLEEARILIIDNVGMLSSIYKYGNIAYIGGGFGAGIHNTLEPIAFGLPVIFGPKYEKFEEARYLVDHKGGFSINDLAAFKQVFTSLEEGKTYQKASQTAKAYIENNKGASRIIWKYIQEYFLKGPFVK